MRKYDSGYLNGATVISEYSKTHLLPHRYLAYKDFARLVLPYKIGKKALDFGCGAGSSSSFLNDEGFTTTGIDVNIRMVEEAKSNFPYIDFRISNVLESKEKFNLVFSSFVLFELSSRDEIVNYLNKAASYLENDGIFYGITGSEELHKHTSNWLCFNVDYKENHVLSSGKKVKLGVSNPDIEFYDYYWKEVDYKSCFSCSNLELHAVHYPLGFTSDPYPWQDELVSAPFVIFVAKLKKS